MVYITDMMRLCGLFVVLLYFVFIIYENETWSGYGNLSGFRGGSAAGTRWLIDDVIGLCVLRIIHNVFVY